MDNGFAERAIRKFAIGRNNWMFADTKLAHIQVPYFIVYFVRPKTKQREYF